MAVRQGRWIVVPLHERTWRFFTGTLIFQIEVNDGQERCVAPALFIQLHSGGDQAEP
ncbi:MAG TPA: hypothetical protein VFB37_04605 [Steroidobacteraceae bacterium]|nr:hypothetical protein [Steroidobacteraceae bacterium]